jgi:hypothetical protein
MKICCWPFSQVSLSPTANTELKSQSSSGLSQDQSSLSSFEEQSNTCFLFLPFKWIKSVVDTTVMQLKRFSHWVIESAKNLITRKPPDAANGESQLHQPFTQNQDSNTQLPSFSQNPTSESLASSLQGTTRETLLPNQLELTSSSLSSSFVQELTSVPLGESSSKKKVTSTIDDLIEKGKELIQTRVNELSERLKLLAPEDVANWVDVTRSPLFIVSVVKIDGMVVGLYKCNFTVAEQREFYGQVEKGMESLRQTHPNFDQGNLSIDTVMFTSVFEREQEVQVYKYSDKITFSSGSANGCLLESENQRVSRAEAAITIPELISRQEKQARWELLSFVTQSLYRTKSL